MQTERLSELTRRHEWLAALDRRKQELDATTDCVRFLALKATLGTGSDAAVLDVFAERYPRSAFTLQRKAAVPPTGIGTGGEALLPPLTDPLVAIMQRNILPARMALTKVPFNVSTPVQSALGTYSWILQGQPKPVSRVTWTSVVNKAGKVSGIVALTRELVKATTGTEAVMAAALTGGAVSFADQSFLDPTVTLDPNGRPASITNGVTPITATGTTLVAKVAELLAALFAGRPQTQRPALIATPAVASQLASGQAVAGQFNGVPVFASPEAGALVVALDAAGVIYSDDGGAVDVSEDASVALDDAPTGTSVLTSFWQTNLVGYRVDRFLWWTKVEGNVVVTLAVTP